MTLSLVLLWAWAGLILPLVPAAFQWLRPPRLPVKCPWPEVKHDHQRWCYARRKGIDTNGDALLMSVFAAIFWPLVLSGLLSGLVFMRLPAWLGRIMPELRSEREWRRAHRPDLREVHRTGPGEQRSLR